MLTDTLTILGAVTLVLLLLGAIYPHLLILTMKQPQKSLSSLNNRIVKFVPGLQGMADQMKSNLEEDEPEDPIKDKTEETLKTSTDHV